MTKDESEMLFQEQADTYGEDQGGRIVQAMTKSKFVEVLASLRVAESNTRSTMLLEEVRQRLLFDTDENGEPKIALVDLLKMWDNINAELQSPPTK